MVMGYKTGATLVVELKMSRMVHDRGFLVVEGPDDVRFWERHRDRDCELVCGESKSSVVDGIERLDGERFRGALGVVDSDYDAIMGIESGSENLVATDAHDLECVLCRSSALEAALAEYGDRTKIEQFEQESGGDVRASLLDRALAFGKLRWAALSCGDTAGLGKIKVPRFLDEETWTVDDEALMAEVPCDSGDSLSTWRRRVAALPYGDPWHVARGHDMLEILRIGLRQVLGDIRASIGVGEIARVLRQAIMQEDLDGTGLWNGVRAWQERNSPYRVLLERV